MQTDISLTITQFFKRALALDLIAEVDAIYLRNRLLAMLQVDEFYEPALVAEPPSLLVSMDKLVEYAVQAGIITDYQYAREVFEAEVMALVTPLPSVVNETFWEKYMHDKKSATDYFYQLSQKNNYIQTRQIAKNIFFETTSPYGNLEITINLSKPEKDPREIAAQKDTVSTDYPKCALCVENEGYQGHAHHAARANHRIVRLDLQGDLYGLHYSPYIYYNEHSIFINKVHQPMVVDRRCIENLLEIVDLLPHYFVGSNADLPIVGGSILTHDHYQGGRYHFPIEDAKLLASFKLTAHPEVEVSMLAWPLSTLRLRAENKKDLVDAVTHIMEVWADYSDEANGIIAHTNGTRHNTVTPIARFKDGMYELDVVLRNNRTSPEYPDGIFHPHPDVQHIKKENIGLIEVMGLAILPPRLVDELGQIEAYLLEQQPLREVVEIHQDWAKELKAVGSYSEKNVSDFIKQKVGDKFTRVLEDAGVFKQNQTGIQGFKKFINGIATELPNDEMNNDRSV